MNEGSLKNHAVATTLDLPPSCIEFSQASPEYFVVGTYNLEKGETEEATHDQENDEDDKPKNEVKAQERNGSLILYKLENDELYVDFLPPENNGIFFLLHTVPIHISPIKHRFYGLDYYYQILNHNLDP
jgi:hypothetical protein